MSIHCAVMRLTLPRMDRIEWQESRLGRHAATCLRCQAETARYRKLHRGLGELAEVTEPAPVSLVAEVEKAIGGEIGEPARVRARVAGAVAAAGAVTAAVAGAAAVIAWRRAHGAT